MKRLCLIILLMVLNLIMVYRSCDAQIFEAYGIIQQLGGDKTTSLGEVLKIADNVAGGFGAGFSVSNVCANIDFIFGSTTISSKAKELDVQLFLFDANVDYSLLKKSISPVITAGIGSVNFSDSNIQASEFSEADFSYNLGVGMRVLLKNHYLIKALYRSTWTRIKNTDDNVQFPGFSIQLGYVL